MAHVLLAGATGETGIEIARALEARGHRLRVLVRTGSRSKLAAAGLGAIAVHEGDVTEPATLTGCCRDIDAVISTVTRTDTTQTHAGVDHAGNLNLLREALAAGVQRFIYVSSIGAGQHPGVPTLREKGRFEAELARAPLSMLVVRPSALFQDMDRIYSQAAGGRLTLFGNGQQRVTPMAEEDLAGYIVDHLVAGTGVVEVGGPETLTMDQVGEYCLAAHGPGGRIRHVPVGVLAAVVAIARVLAPQAWPVLRFVQYVFTTDNAAPTVGRTTLRDHLARRHAGIAAHAARESLFRS